MGLAASMHVLAAADAEHGFAEVDANPGPLREHVFPLAIEHGRVMLSAAAGLGVEPDLRRLARFMVSARRSPLGAIAME